MMYKQFLQIIFFLISIIVVFNPLVLLGGITKNLIFTDSIKLLSIFIIIYIILNLFLKKTIWKVIITMLIMVISEIALLNILKVNVPQVMTKKDLELGWVWIAGSSRTNEFEGHSVTLRINSLGLRGGEIKNQKKLFLGNSIVQAQHVLEEKTFSSLLNGINAGFDGYDTYMEINRFNRDLYKLDIDSIILMVSPIDISSRESSRNKVRQTLKVNKDIKKNIVLDWIKNLYILHMSKNIFHYKVKENIAQKDQWYLNVSRKKVNKIIWSEWTNYILRLKKHFKGSLSIVLSPPRSMYKNHKLGERYWINYNLEYFCQSNDIKFVDILPFLPRNKDLYIDYVHYNEFGHKIVSEIISQQLTRNLDE